jgi:hypothetical protein
MTSLTDVCLHAVCQRSFSRQDCCMHTFHDVLIDRAYPDPRSEPMLQQTERRLHEQELEHAQRYKLKRYYMTFYRLTCSRKGYAMRLVTALLAESCQVGLLNLPKCGSTLERNDESCSSAQKLTQTHNLASKCDSLSALLCLAQGLLRMGAE